MAWHAGCFCFFLWLPLLLFYGTKAGDEGQSFREPGGERRGWLAREKLARPSSNRPSKEEFREGAKADTTNNAVTMARSLLLLALVASVSSSVSGAAAQVSSGGIRGSSAAAGTESSGISSSLASAAAAVLKVWPHPAAQVLHHATDAVRRKLVSAACVYVQIFM